MDKEIQSSERINPESLKLLSFAISVLSPVLTTDFRILKTCPPKKVVSALEFLIKFANGEKSFKATRTEIADSGQKIRKTFVNHLRALFNWQNDNGFSLVGYQDDENPKNGTYWELPILDVIEGVAATCLKKKVAVTLFEVIRKNYPSEPELDEEIGVEDVKLVKDLIKSAQMQIMRLPSLPNIDREARTRTKEVNLERKQRNDSIKQGDEKAERFKKEKCERKVLEANDLYEQDKQDITALRNKLNAEIELYRLNEGRVLIAADLADNRIREIVTEIYQKIIEIKLIFDGANAETKKFVESRFELYERILRIDLDI